MDDRSTFEHVKAALLTQIKASRATYHQFSWLMSNRKKSMAKRTAKKAA